MEKELHLIEKKRTGLFALIFSRTGVILILFALAVLTVLGIMNWFAGLIAHITAGIILFNIIVIIYLVNSEMDSSAKTTWILVIAITSIFGTLFYLYTRSSLGYAALREGHKKLLRDHKDDLIQDSEAINSLETDSPETRDLVTYLNRSGTYPVTQHNEVTYYPLGEDKWKDMLIELEKAKHFIFMEYFIIDEGKMWGTILAILKRKAEEGVEVRVMYDGMCALSTLPLNYPKMLEDIGIKAKMFSPLTPFVSTHYNYRDHRKILVIDGKVGFNGGVNLADEYVNEIERFGHWKDTAIRIKGPAVKNLTLMFLNMWEIFSQDADYAKYLNVPADLYDSEKGYVIPYADNPFDDDKVGEKVYMSILNRANHYVHIMSPYLILDDELLMALKYAAERSIDVKLILPGIPDKKMVYNLAKRYFRTLLDSGVKIYLYTPGFVHAKVFVSDDMKAVVGTINLDYRSLYHHFECATYLYDTDCIKDIEEDFTKTLESCHQVTIEDVNNEKFLVRLTGSLARLIAPLL